MHNTTQTRYDTQKEKQTWKTCKIGIIFWKPTNPNQLNKIYPNHIRASYSQQKHKTQEIKARIKKFFKKNREPVPFLED